MSDPLPAELESYPVVVSVPVQWGDQDAFGHVNNTVPIRWFETARVAYWERALAGPMMSGGTGPILAAIHCNYRRQLEYPDQVLVGAKAGRLGRSSMTIEHVVWSVSQGVIAADGASTIVVFNYQTQRPVRIPSELREAMEKLEGRSLSGDGSA